MSGGLPRALQQELLWGSQCGSQRAQTLSYVRRRQTNVVLGEGYARRCQATSGGWVGLIWEQEAAGSNPAIPTKGAGRGACFRPSSWRLRSFDRHLTVELNANRRQRLSRTGPKGQGWWVWPWLVLNRFLVLTQSTSSPARDERGDWMPPSQGGSAGSNPVGATSEVAGQRPDRRRRRSDVDLCGSRIAAGSGLMGRSAATELDTE